MTIIIFEPDNPQFSHHASLCHRQFPAVHFRFGQELLNFGPGDVGDKMKLLMPATHATQWV